MHNHIETAICQGNERLVDSKKNTLHPTQKPEKVIRHLMEVSSNRGDKVFDGFMGTGTTAKVSRDNGRKFIGIEKEKNFFEAAQERLK
jgi:site-specific DNA-methyltransferase (adenine-specific)/modification methylase